MVNSKARNFTVEEKEVYYDRLVQQIERKDQALDRRISWMLTTQGLLFAALALAAGENGGQIRQVVTEWVPRVGIALSVIGFMGVLGVGLAQRHLQAEWRALEYDAPRPMSEGLAGTLIASPSFLLPLVFLIVWVVILGDV